MIYKLLAAFMVLICLLTGCGARGGDSDNSPAQSASVPEASSSTVPSGSRSGSQPEVLSSPRIDEGAESDLTDDTPERTVVTLTVPEGYTLPRIGMTLEDMGVCTAEAFIDAAQNGDFSMYSLVAAQKEDPDRCFKLEGYLFPATYEMYSDEPPETIIHRMLSHLEKTVSAEIRDMVDASGYTFDEVLTLASIIEKEAFGYQYMPDISSVLHNRLDTGMRLQCDVTINYVEGAIKPFITGDTERYNEHYNTYKCAGIPSGAICNPGLDAILAAVSPGETDYLYFVTDKDKNYHFSATWEDHEANVAAIKAQTPASSAA